MLMMKRRSSSKKNKAVAALRQEQGVEVGFDVLVHAFSFLDDERDLGRCAMVSRAWCEAADSHVLWRHIIGRLSQELGVDLIARFQRHRQHTHGTERQQAESTATDQRWSFKRLYVTHVRDLKSMHQALDHLNRVRLPARQGAALTQCKIVTTGSNGVGKTCMLLACTSPGWSLDDADYIPTVFDNWEATVDVDEGNRVIASLWDTANPFSKFRCFQSPIRYPDTDCILVCFAVDDWTSLEEARDKFVPDVRVNGPPTTQIVLVGTKADLRETKDASSLIPVGTGVEVAKALGLVAYVECSAKTSYNVSKILCLAIKVPLLRGAGLLTHDSAGRKGKKQQEQKKKAGDKCSLQ